MANKSVFAIFLIIILQIGAESSLASEALITGIPNPEFGLNETTPPRPTSWPDSPTSNYYFVDNTHPNSTDSFNEFGTPSKPRQTIPDGVLAAGTYIEIHGGPYTGGYEFRANGTLLSPVWVTGNSESRPIFTGSLAVTDSTYLIIENLDFNGGISGAISVSASSGSQTHHVAIRDFAIRNRTWGGNNSAALGIGAHDNAQTHDVVISNCLIHDLASEVDWQDGVDRDFHGIAPNVYGRDATSGVEVSDIWIIGCEGHHISGNFVQVVGQAVSNGYAGDILHHIYVGGNSAYSNRQAGYWTKTARDVIFSRNLSHSARAYSAGSGDGGGYQYGPDFVWWIFNEFHNNNFGIRQSSTPSDLGFQPQVFMVGNLIYNCKRFDTPTKSDAWREGVGISLWHGGTKRYIVDNTIANCNTGIISIYDNVGDIQLSGNLIFETADDEPFIDVSHVARAGRIQARNNLFYNTGGIELFSWNWAVYTSLSSLEAADQNVAENIVANPDFFRTNHVASDRDYSLSSSSPAIDQNSTMTPDGTDVYSLFEERYGINIEVDFLGNPRTAGSHPDIGAFEFQDFDRPAPPTDLQAE